MNDRLNKLFWFYLFLLMMPPLFGQSKKELESQIIDLKNEKMELTRDNRSSRDSLKVKKVEIAKLKHKLDSLSQRMLTLQKTTPARLQDSIESLHKVIQHFETRLRAAEDKKIPLQDTIRSLKSKLRALYTVPGNQAKRITHYRHTYDCYVVDLKSSDLQFFWKDKNRPILSLKNLDQIVGEGQKTLVFATNAGMYLKDHSPQGLFVQHGKTLVQADRKKEEYGNFYMQPNGIFLIDSNNVARVITTDQYDQNTKGIKFATQSGPMVLINKEVNQKFKQNSDNLNIRSGVGLIDSTHVVFVISNQPVNFYDFATLFKEKFNCTNALYLDGAISEMYLPELGRFQDGGNFGAIIGIIKK